MKAIFLVTFAISLTAIALAHGTSLPKGETLRTLNWPYSPPNPNPMEDAVANVQFSFDLVPDSADPDHLSLKMVYTGKGCSHFSFFPAAGGLLNGLQSIVTTHHFAVTGEVKYEKVPAGSFLEMWSHFDSAAPGYPQGDYFSRTLAPSGPMGKLEGTSDWREFWLPFDSTGSEAKLSRIDLNLQLAGPGTVHLRRLELMQYPDGPAAVRVPTSSTANAGAPSELLLSMSEVDGALKMTVAGVAYSSMPELKSMLASRAQADPKLLVVIRADRDVPYAEITKVLDACRDAGLQQISFANEVGPYPKASGSEGPVKATRHGAVEWRSFWLGVMTTMVSLLGTLGLRFGGRWIARRRHEGELRRIASLDG